jgi:hypothetical protein
LIAQRARYAVIALGVAETAYAFAVLSDIIALPLLDDPTDFDALTRFDGLTATTGLVQILALVVAAVFFIRWFNLVHRSLDAMCPGVRRHDTWWSIGGWFIPIMTLFRPKQILDDMLVCANGEGSRRPWWAPTWWGLWLVGSLAGNGAGQAFFGADTLEALHTATVVDAVASAVLVAGGVVAIVVVRRLTEMVELKRGEVAARAAIVGMGPGAAHELVGGSDWR